MEFNEKFNRYYTDPNWQPTRTRYVSRSGAGSGNSREDPAAVLSTLQDAQPGDKIIFLKDAVAYEGCFPLEEAAGTYDDPIVLYAERNGDLRGVTINCCQDDSYPKRASCFNLEGAKYVAIDGFEFNGGNYGTRIVGGYPTAQHVSGNAVLNCFGHDQDNDPFFTGASDWFVIENNVAARGGSGDGHGIYLSNGSDWNIARFNDLYDNHSSDFQINADPQETCWYGEPSQYDPNDDRCDGPAGSGQGDGVSEYILVEGNYFHNERRQGANLTSVRNSVVRNNVFAFYAMHGVSFWQETDNPNLGSHSNLIQHNLFIATSGDQVLGFGVYSGNNDVRNNVLMTLNVNASSASVNENAPIVAIDVTVTDNTYGGNLLIGGTCLATDGEDDLPTPCDLTTVGMVLSDFSPTWFTNFPFEGDLDSVMTDFVPTSTAPWLNTGQLLTGTQTDWDGTTRTAPVDGGPFEVP